MSRIKEILFFFLFSPLLFSQEGMYLEFTGLVYENESQLKGLYEKYDQTLLIVENQIYLIPCECSPCRNRGGDDEGRNMGGDGDDRNLGGDGDNRSLGGDGDRRNLGGDGDNRNLGGDGDGRNLGGDMAGRDGGGDGDDRNMGGDGDRHNLGGDGDDRNSGGDASGRNQGADAAGRNASGNMALRSDGGSWSSFSCEPKSKKRFILLDIHRNAEVYYFNGLELVKVDMKKGLIKS